MLIILNLQLPVVLGEFWKENMIFSQSWMSSLPRPSKCIRFFNLNPSQMNFLWISSQMKCLCGREYEELSIIIFTPTKWWNHEVRNSNKLHTEMGEKLWSVPNKTVTTIADEISTIASTTMDLRIWKNGISQWETPKPPSPAVVGPFIENSGDYGFARGSISNILHSIIFRQWRFVTGTDVVVVGWDAAQRMHRSRPHHGLPLRALISFSFSFKDNTSKNTNN